MSEKVTIKLQGDDYQIAWGENGQATRHYWLDLIAAAGRYSECTISDEMAVALIQNRKAIEKLLAKGATAVEVKLDWEIVVKMTPTSRGSIPRVTLTPISAGPWPALDEAGIDLDKFRTSETVSSKFFEGKA